MACSYKLVVTDGSGGEHTYQPGDSTAPGMHDGTEAYFADQPSSSDWWMNERSAEGDKAKLTTVPSGSVYLYMQADNMSAIKAEWWKMKTHSEEDHFSVTSATIWTNADGDTKGHDKKWYVGGSAGGYLKVYESR